MRLLSLFLCLSACGGAAQADKAPGRIVSQAGILQNSEISEASGLARSNLDQDLLWIINDGGSPPVLHAIGKDGSDRGSVRLRNAPNTDWEDLASFEAGGKSWLVIADIGDNQGNRPHVELYFVEEPPLPRATATVARRIAFVYADGPQDAEAMAVDIERQQVLILTKRTVPAVLYAVPLELPAGELAIARKLGEIDSIPQPTHEDLERALPEQDWHWQPTGMDISNDGHAAAIISYRAVYEFERKDGESWYEALQSAPSGSALGEIRAAEAVAFDDSGQSIFVTVEKLYAPLLRFDIAQ